MTDARVRELLIRFSEEGGLHSMNGLGFRMFRALWFEMFRRGGDRGLWLKPKGIR